MTKRNYNYKGFVKKAFSLIINSIKIDLTIQKFSNYLKELVNSYIGLNRNDRYLLYSTVLQVYKNCKHRLKNNEFQQYLALRSTYDTILRASRRVMRNKDLKDKREKVKELLNQDGFIFYVCSKHIKPAEDHKDYQGKIYVDRFWRTKVDKGLYRAISAYIKNHQVVTIQEIMGPPVYMTTRPYCKHYFSPVATYDVLYNSASKIVNTIGVHKPKMYTATEYFDLRSSIYTLLDTISPCNSFKQKQKKKA